MYSPSFKRFEMAYGVCPPKEAARNRVASEGRRLTYQIIIECDDRGVAASLAETLGEGTRIYHLPSKRCVWKEGEEGFSVQESWSEAVRVEAEQADPELEGEDVR